MSRSLSTTPTPLIGAPPADLSAEQRRHLLRAHAVTAREEAVTFERRSVTAKAKGDLVWAQAFVRESLRARVVARDVEDRLGTGQ